MNDWFRMELRLFLEFSSYYRLSLIVVFYSSCSLLHCSRYVQEKASNYVFAPDLRMIFVPFRDYDFITVMMSETHLANMWGLVILYPTYVLTVPLCWLYKNQCTDSLDEGGNRWKLTVLHLSSNHFPMLKLHATTLIINASGSEWLYVANCDSE